MSSQRSGYRTYTAKVLFNRLVGDSVLYCSVLLWTWLAILCKTASQLPSVSNLEIFRPQVQIAVFHFSMNLFFDDKYSTVRHYVNPQPITSNISAPPCSLAVPSKFDIQYLDDLVAVYSRQFFTVMKF